MEDIEKFLRGYIRGAFWSTLDDGGYAFDTWASQEDIAEETLARMRADCEKFLRENGALITEANFLGRYDYTLMDRAGHDFWLTREGHGAGFWDGAWAESVATKLTDAAHAFGEADLYLGDDGCIHQG